jgi:hypothetical protein
MLAHDPLLSALGRSSTPPSSSTLRTVQPIMNLEIIWTFSPLRTALIAWRRVQASSTMGIMRMGRLPTKNALRPRDIGGQQSVKRTENLALNQRERRSILRT